MSKKAVPMAQDKSIGKLVRVMQLDGCRVEIYDGGYANKTAEEIEAQRRHIGAVAYRIALEAELRREGTKA